MNGNNSWKPVDWVILLLAGSIATIALFNGVARYFAGEEFNPERAKVLGDFLKQVMVMVIVAMYIGLKLRDRDE